jgi:hypothetical protein
MARNFRPARRFTGVAGTQAKSRLTSRVRSRGTPKSREPRLAQHVLVVRLVASDRLWIDASGGKQARHGQHEFCTTGACRDRPSASRHLCAVERWSGSGALVAPWVATAEGVSVQVTKRTGCEEGETDRSSQDDRSVSRSASRRSTSSAIHSIF